MKKRLLLVLALFHCGGSEHPTSSQGVTSPSAKQNAEEQDSTSTTAQAPTKEPLANGTSLPAVPPKTDSDGAASRNEVIQVQSIPLGAQEVSKLQPTVPQRIATVPMRLAKTPKVVQAREILTRVIHEYGRDIQRPAVLVHALLALGPEIEATDGRKAVDALFETWAQFQDMNGVDYVSFPRRAGNTPVEAHRGIILKTLTEIGVSPSRPIQVGDETLTVADLYRSTLLHTWVSIRGDAASPSFSGPRDMAWTLQGLSTWAPEPALSWTTLDGKAQTLNDFSLFNFVVLHTDTQPLFQAQDAGASFDKYRMENGHRVGVGPYQHSCGAAHALQASAYAIARGYGKNEKVVAGMNGQVRNMFWRLSRELAITDGFLARPSLTPTEVSWLLVQQLKTTGHFLESMSKLSALGYYRPNTEQQIILQGALDRLVEVILFLEQRGTLDTQMPGILKSDPQLFMDLVNDSAHALNGMELAMGDRSVHF